MGMYRRQGRFTVGNVAGPVDVSALRWTADTPEDLEFVRRICAELHSANPALAVEGALAPLER